MSFLVRPDDRTKRALALLRSADMQSIILWMAEENGRSIRVLMESPDPVLINRMQGKTQFIDELLQLVQKND